jgi:hypothetical protein
MRPHYSYVTETKTVTKCVDRGHYECREEYSHWKAFCNHLGNLSCHHNDCCCDPCPPNNCVPRKVWVPCMVQECCPVTCCRKVCEMRPECIKVQTCRTEWREEKCKVCVTRCIPETRVEKYTVCLNRMVPYEATRTVCVQVPCEENVTCTRWVTRQVTREVPCCDPCTTCCDTCNPCCQSRHSLFGGGGGLFSGCSLFGHGCGGCGGGLFSGHGCGGGLFSGCGSSCGYGCGSSRGCCN